MAGLPNESKQLRVFLWCWPRSMSTALEKCLSFVDGVQMWHEPYLVPGITQALGHLAQTTPKEQDMADLKKHDNSEFSGGSLMPVEKFTYPWIKSQLEKEEPGKDYIFVKDMACSIYGHQDALPDVPSRHTFLVRHPYPLMASYRKMMMLVENYHGDPVDYGIPPMVGKYFFDVDYTYLLWKNVQESAKDPSPIIIDADDLVNYPEKILPKYLGALGIPYRDSYASWDASEEVIKTWKGALEWLARGKAQGVHERSFASSRFLPRTEAMPRREDLDPDIEGIADRMMPGYQDMYKHRMTPE